MSRMFLTSRLREQSPGNLYHVMNRGIDHQNIFFEDVDYLSYLTILKRACEKYNAAVVAYCLMPNHYHLLLYPLETKLSLVVQYIDGQYARRFNFFHERDGSLFKGRFRSEVIDSKEYLHSVVDYIHHNPTKANLCAIPVAYRWSSASSFHSKTQTNWYRPHLAAQITYS